MKTPSLALSWFFVFANPFCAYALDLLVFGDSFAAGYGLPEHEGFCAQLEKKLEDYGVDVDVINAGVSGDTTTGAVARASETYSVKHDMVLLEIGANDMLRGMPVDLVRANIEHLIEASETPLFLVGIRAYPNYGMRYAESFDRIYPDLAREKKTGYYPFLFEKIFEKPRTQLWRYFQPDQLHPNARGVELVVSDLAPHMLDWMESEGIIKTRKCNPEKPEEAHRSKCYGISGQE